MGETSDDAELACAPPPPDAQHAGEGQRGRQVGVDSTGWVAPKWELLDPTRGGGLRSARDQLGGFDITAN